MSPKILAGVRFSVTEVFLTQCWVCQLHLQNPRVIVSSARPCVRHMSVMAAQSVVRCYCYRATPTFQAYRTDLFKRHTENRNASALSERFVHCTVWILCSTLWKASGWCEFFQSYERPHDLYVQHKGWMSITYEEPYQFFFHVPVCLILVQTIVRAIACIEITFRTQYSSKD